MSDAFQDTCGLCNGKLEPTGDDMRWVCVDCAQEWYIDEETRPITQFKTLRDEVVEHKRKTGELPLLDDIHDVDTQPSRTRRMIDTDMLTGKDDEAQR